MPRIVLLSIPPPVRIAEKDADTRRKGAYQVPQSLGTPASLHYVPSDVIGLPELPLLWRDTTA